LLILFAFFLFCANEEEEKQLGTKWEPIPPRPPQYSYSESLYRQNGCASCHGAKGDGQGEYANSEGMGFLPNFTSAAGFRSGSSQAAIRRSISNGILGTKMGAYSYLKFHELEAITHFVYELRKK